VVVQANECVEEEPICTANYAENVVRRMVKIEEAIYKPASRRRTEDILRTATDY